MKIVWDWSVQSEAERLGEMCSKVASGFYHLHYFLPIKFELNKPRKDSSHLVYLPDLPYSSIPHFWESVAKSGITYPLPTLTITHRLSGLISDLYLPKLSLPQLEKDSQLYLPPVIDWLKSTFPTLSLPDSFLIHPTYFGTLGSFFWDKKSNQAILYLRSDQSLHTLIEIVLSAILRPHANTTLYPDWEKTEYLVDYLLINSSLKNLFPSAPSWQPTTNPPHYSQAITKESATFTHILGTPNQSSSHFSVKASLTYFGDTPLTNLTQRENIVMQKLITSSPNALTTDQIGDLLFSQEEKFSLAAINKTIERLRKKLGDLGISSAYLATASELDIT
jgi:hypothetical protein